MLLRIIFLALLSIPIINIIYFFVHDVSKDLNKESSRISKKHHTRKTSSKQYLKVAK